MLLTLAIWFMASRRVVTFHLSLKLDEAIDSTLENLSMESFNLNTDLDAFQFLYEF